MPKAAPQLRERLHRIFEDVPSREDFRARLERTESRRHPSSLAAFLEGEWRHRSSGRILCVEKSHPDAHHHGGYPFREIHEIDRDCLSLLAGHPAFTHFDPEQCLFLDTETTGLDGGAGTYVFLIGLGYFEQDRFRLLQFFLPDLHSERALLEEVGTLLRDRSKKDFQFLISFNGKGYDLNLLSNRFILQRLSEPFGCLHHLDLLYPSRALWKGLFEDCALQTLERRLLNIFREADIPSYLIPRTYFQFIHTGRFRALGSIFEHNRLDLMSLVSLLTLMVHSIEKPDCRVLREPLTAARLCVRRGEYLRAEAVLEHARQHNPVHSRQPDFWFQLAAVKKKLGQTEQALDCWREVIRQDASPPVEVFEEIAKIMEHGKRTFNQALAIVDQGLRHYPDSPGLRHRRFRLLCRLEGKRWY